MFTQRSLWDRRGVSASRSSDMRSFAAIVVMALLGGASIAQDKPLTPFEAGRQLGKVDQALGTAKVLAEASKDKALIKELAEWQEEYTKLEARLRAKAEKGESIGGDLQTSLRLLEKGVGSWSGKLAEGRLATRPAAPAPSGTPLLPGSTLLPGNLGKGLPPNVLVTVDLETLLAMQLLESFASHPEVRRQQERIEAQMKKASEGLDFNQPGSMREYFKRLNQMGVDNANKGTRPPPKK